MYVAHFDQQTDALHTVGWSNHLFGVLTTFSFTNGHKKKHKKSVKTHKKGVYPCVGASPKPWQTPKSWAILGKSRSFLLNCGHSNSSSTAAKSFYMI